MDFCIETGMDHKAEVLDSMMLMMMNDIYDNKHNLAVKL